MLQVQSKEQCQSWKKKKKKKRFLRTRIQGGLSKSLLLKGDCSPVIRVWREEGSSASKGADWL